MIKWVNRQMRFPRPGGSWMPRRLLPLVVGLTLAGGWGCERDNIPVGPTRFRGRVAYHAVVNVSGALVPQIFFFFPDDPSNPRQLTKTRTQEVAPRWSPDGQKIAFLSNRTTGSQFFRLFVMDMNGSNVRELFSPLVHPPGDLDFSWSPDGQKIALVNRVQGFRLNVPQLYIVDVHTLERQLVAASPPNRFSPDWSPDGTKIAFVSTVSGSGTSTLDIMSYPALTIETVDLELRTVNFPRWSPDGQTLAFIGRPGSDSEIQIYAATGPDLSSVRQVTQIPGGLPNAGPLTWSPDGRRLLFPAPGTNPFDPDSRDLFSIRLDGTELTRVTASPFDESAPDWTPLE